MSKIFSFDNKPSRVENRPDISGGSTVQSQRFDTVHKLNWRKCGTTVLKSECVISLLNKEIVLEMTKINVQCTDCLTVKRV